MECSWKVVFLAGLVWAIAEATNINKIADELTVKMNANVHDHSGEWYELPGFMVNFTQETGNYSWNVADGEMTSFDDLKRSGPAQVERNGNDSFLTIPVNMNNVRSDYTFSCTEEKTELEGNYNIFTTVNVGAAIKIKITRNRSNCTGELQDLSLHYLTDCKKLNFEGDDLHTTGTCPYSSWTAVEDYTVPLLQHFCADYPKSLKKLFYSSAKAAISGFNFCPS